MREKEIKVLSEKIQKDAANLNAAADTVMKISYFLVTLVGLIGGIGSFALADQSGVGAILAIIFTLLVCWLMTLSVNISANALKVLSNISLASLGHLEESQQRRISSDDTSNFSAGK